MSTLGELVDFEHKVQQATDFIERTGIKADMPYTSNLNVKLGEESAQWREVAAGFGIENVNANAQIVQVLLKNGAKLTERTDSGKDYKVDNKVLHKVAEQSDRLGEITHSVLKAKQLEKRRTSYCVSIMENADANDRVHASINSLGARTARMSVDTPPLQQLPSDEALIRLCFCAEHHGGRAHVHITCDYDQVEFRIAGELSGEPKIIRAAQKGQSIHDVTTRQLFGHPYTPKQYKIGKNTGFGFLFGGGATTLARQAEIPLSDAAGVVKRYREEFPQLAVWKRNVTESVLEQALTGPQYRFYRSLRKSMYDYEPDHPKRIEIRAKMDDICRGRAGTVVTPSGRRIKVDAQRPYSGVNYIVQSTARDVLAAGLLRLMEIPQIARSVVMVVHDEVVAEVPEEHAALYCDAFASLMSTEFGRVPLTASAEICGESWGMKYVPKEA